MGNITEILNRLKNSIFGKDVRDSIIDGIKQCYNDAIANGHTDMEVANARGLYNNLNERLNGEKNILQNQINELASGSPLVASSTSEMTDTTRTYVNISDGNWYYYNGTVWVSGGAYQSTQINKNDTVIKGLNSKIEGLSRKNFFYGDCKISLSVLELLGNYSLGVETGYLSFLTQDTMTTKYFYAERNMNIYVKSEELQSLEYFAIGTLHNPAGEFVAWGTSGVRQYGDNPQRYRSTNNDLPTKSNPLSILEGDLVAFLLVQILMLKQLVFMLKILLQIF